MFKPSHSASQPDSPNRRVAFPISPAGMSIAERSARFLSQSPLALISATTPVDGQKTEPDSPRAITYPEFDSNHSGIRHSPWETCSLGCVPSTGRNSMSLERFSRDITIEGPILRNWSSCIDSDCMAPSWPRIHSLCSPGPSEVSFSKDQNGS